MFMSETSNAGRNNKEPKGVWGQKHAWHINNPNARKTTANIQPEGYVTAHEQNMNVLAHFRLVLLQIAPSN